MSAALELKQKYDEVQQLNGPGCAVILSWDLAQRLIQEFKDFKERVSALESKEVCTMPHDDEVLDSCPYCRLEGMRTALEECEAASSGAMLGLPEDRPTALRFIEHSAKRGLNFLEG